MQSPQRVQISQQQPNTNQQEKTNNNSSHPVTKLACGCYHTLIVTGKSNSKLLAFGRNRHGQLGDGTTIDRYGPVKVNFKGGEILQVAAGFYHSVILSAKQQANSLAVDMLQLLNSGKYSDVAFIVEGKQIPAHKCIVSARSQPLMSLLFGRMRESTQRQIIIKDTSQAAFRAVLQYLYTDSVDRLSLLQICSLGQQSGQAIRNEDLDFVIELLSLADLYLIDSLKAYCARIIQPNINIDNVCSILLIADARFVERLKYKCIQFISSNFKHMIVQKSFVELPSNLLHQVLVEASKKLCLELADHSS